MRVGKGWLFTEQYNLSLCQVTADFLGVPRRCCQVGGHIEHKEQSPGST